MCLKQDLTKEQWHTYVEKLMQTTEVPDKFRLTEEQLVQTAIEENISITQVECVSTSKVHFQLNDSQIQSLIAQINAINSTLSSSMAPSEQEQAPLVLHLDQFIELCNQLAIDIGKRLDDKVVSQRSSLIVSSQFKFTLTPAQIAYLIDQAKFDITKLISIEQTLKKHDIQAQSFRLNSSQVTYLLAHHRSVRTHGLAGLSVAQLIALYVLQHQANRTEQTLLFALTYQQIQRLALSQNMTLLHLQSLSSSKNSLQLTHDQLIYIIMENKTPVHQIISIHDDQKSTLLDRQQLCSLISHNDQRSTLQNSSPTHPSVNELDRTAQRVCLSVEQILVLMKYSHVKSHQLITCNEEYMNIGGFRFKPEQLAMLWTMSASPNDLKHRRSSSIFSPQFILTDDQFRSLLHFVSPSVLLTHSPSTTTRKSNIEVSSESISSPILRPIESNEPSDVRQPATDIQNRLPSTLANHLAAMHERLKSSVQAHAETVSIVSNAMLKRHRVEDTVDLVHQSSLHSIDDISNKEVETIPSFVLDLLKMDTVTENIYTSVKQGEVTSEMSKTIVQSIQTDQLSFSQIQKIQTQLLTPKLIEEFKSGHLSQHVLDAYKSLSPLQLIHKVRSSKTQLNTLLLQQLSNIAQPDARRVSIMRQNAASNPNNTSDGSNADSSNIDEQRSSTQQVDVEPQTTEQKPIIIYPQSAILRQEIVQELRDRLDNQCLELKKEYGIEPAKGQASIHHITNKLRTTAMIKDLQSLIDRQIDEVDILNILEGHLNHLLVQVPVATSKTTELIDRNIQYRVNRMNERLQLVNLLRNHIETERLKRQMNLEEYTALVFENVTKFEQLTDLHLTEDDLRIISMNRFASVERSLTRSLTESEYRHLLEIESPINYIEQELLKRPLTTDERIEQKDLTLIPYEELIDNQTPMSEGKEIESVKPTHAQLEQILQRRAELVDQYDILHSISPSIKQIEDKLARSLTIDEKKGLTRDDYSIIKQTKTSKDIARKPSKILPITASLLELVEHTQDKNLLENIEHLETDLERSLTKQELVAVAKGDVGYLEQMLGKSLSIATIQSMYKERFIKLTEELNRDLSKKEICDMLNEDFSGIESALDRQLTSTERLTYKPANIIDLTASRLTDVPSIDTTIGELEDVLKRPLTSHEVQHLIDQPASFADKHSSAEKLNTWEPQTIDVPDSKTGEDDSSISRRLVKRAIQFSLLEIEKSIERSLNGDELAHFSGSRFAQIESDLGKPLNDLQRANLLKGDKLTIQSLIHRTLSPTETGPHLVDLANIEEILNRSLTYDELTRLSADRFDHIRRILQRALTEEELIDLLHGNDEKIRRIMEEKLDREKEIQLKELPINRIRYFETILRRKLSSNELLRFAEDCFEPLLRLLSDLIKTQQILDLSSGRYDKIEAFFNHPLTLKERYELDKSILQVHLKYPTILDELESLIQRRLSEGELRNLVGDEYHHIEQRLGRTLTEKQLRNLIHADDDPSLVGAEELFQFLKKENEDDWNRTRKIVVRLVEKLDEDYHEHEQRQQQQAKVEKTLKSPSRSPLIGEKQSEVDFHQSTNDLLEQLADDVRQHAVVTPRDHSSEERSPTSDVGSVFEKERTPTPVVSPSISERESIKAFENIPRMVEHLADQEHLEEMVAVNDAIEKFQEDLPRTIEKTIVNAPTSRWVSKLAKDSLSFHLPTIKSIEGRSTIPESHPTEIQPEEDIYLGWTLFKSADRPDLGLKEEKPLLINVKHHAQTYVVGIPEEYADAKSKTIVNKIYEGGTILYRSSISRIIKKMGEFVSELFHRPMISDATHFIVPSRAYIDIIEPAVTYQSEMIEIEDDELQMRDSPETLEWYEECIQRNVQVHAQIPTGYYPSIVYCHTGRRTVITPAKRAEQQKAVSENSVHKFQTGLNRVEANKQENLFTFNSGSTKKLTEPTLDAQSRESPSTARTVTDLIMHTVTSSQKTDLLEALEELFSQENLEKYQMTETHWQDIFLILLNSYLRSHALNRKEIFKRLTDKLQELRVKERRHSSEHYPSISVASPSVPQTLTLFNEMDTNEATYQPFHFGSRSSLVSMTSDRSPNQSNYSISPATTGQPSITSHESITPLSNKHPSTHSLPQNYSAAPTSDIVIMDLISNKPVYSSSDIDQVSPSSTEQVSKSLTDEKPHRLPNSNAILEQQCPPIPQKHRRYKITVLHSDVLSEASSNNGKKTSESIKLPSITSRRTSSQTKRSTTTGLTDNHPLLSSSTSKRIRTKIFSNFRNKSNN